MKVIYEAFDGTRFDNEPECLEYEYKAGKTDIVMLDCCGNYVTKTDSAAFVWLKDEHSAALFHSLARDIGDLVAASTIPEKECGFFFWDDCDDRYQYISESAIDSLATLRTEVELRGLES
jgi:hypothetical protein